MADGKSVLIEVKAEWQKDDPIVQAKREAAERLADSNAFSYELLTKEQFQKFVAGLSKAAN